MAANACGNPAGGGAGTEGACGPAPGARLGVLGINFTEDTVEQLRQDVAELRLLRQREAREDPVQRVHLRRGAARGGAGRELLEVHCLGFMGGRPAREEDGLGIAPRATDTQGASQTNHEGQCAPRTAAERVWRPASTARLEATTPRRGERGRPPLARAGTAGTQLRPSSRAAARRGRAPRGEKRTPPAGLPDPCLLSPLSPVCWDGRQQARPSAASERVCGRGALSSASASLFLFLRKPEVSPPCAYVRRP